MSKECTTHHHACDCREEKFKELERENAELRELLHRSLDWLDDYDLRLSGSAKIADDIKEVLRKEAQP